MKRYIVALDEGTTSARAVVYDVSEKKIISTAAHTFELSYPEPGWVEADALSIWGAQSASLGEVIAESGVSADEIYGIGVTNQRESVLIWDKRSGKPLHNAIIWQCRRTADYCEYLRSDPGVVKMIKQRTGLTVDSYFSATKLAWLLDNVEGAREKALRGEILAGTLDSYIIYRLTEGKSHVTDVTNASRTMLYNINEMCWDKELLRLFRIPEEILPEVIDSDAIAGKGTAVKGAPVICGILGDQQAALFGQACFEKGDAKNTYGTGCFILVNTGEKAVYSENNLITTIGWRRQGKTVYAIEGSVFNAGSAVQWLRDKLDFMKSSEDSERMARAAKNGDGTPGCDGVYVVPAFTGLGAPYWRSEARGVITGITRNTDKFHIVRAVLESMAYSTKDVLDCIEADLGSRIMAVRADGGASRNDFLMEFQADISGLKVLRPECTESTVMGAVYMCGMGLGVWKREEEIKSLVRVEKEFVPTLSKDAASKLYSGWRQAVSKA